MTGHHLTTSRKGRRLTGCILHKLSGGVAAWTGPLTTRLQRRRAFTDWRECLSLSLRLRWCDSIPPGGMMNEWIDYLAAWLVPVFRYFTLFTNSANVGTPEAIPSFGLDKIIVTTNILPCPTCWASKNKLWICTQENSHNLICSILTTAGADFTVSRNNLRWKALHSPYTHGASKS